MNLLLIALLVYGLVALVLLRPFIGHVAWWQVEHWYPRQSAPDGADWFLAIIAGSLGAVVWVAWPVLYLIGRIVARAFASTPRIGAEARHLRAERAERTARLEREIFHA